MEPRVGLYRGISDGELLRAHGLFVAEGRLVVRRVIADSRYRVHSVLVNNAARWDLTDALEQLSAAVPISIVPTSEFPSSPATTSTAGAWRSFIAPPLSASMTCCHGQGRF